MFRDQGTKEKFLFDDVGGYYIDEKLYKKHKSFLDEEVPFKFILIYSTIGLE